jgi:AmpD protein
MMPGSGWLPGVERCPSPNCNARPDPVDISLLVIHNISLPPGEFGGACIREFFCNQLDCSRHPYFEQLRDMQVSAHLLIERDGNVVQFVPFELRAWHAGESCFDGCTNCNDFSIGIELEGTDDDAYTEAQYTSLARVSHTIMQHYPAITAQRITGHSDIAPGRKTDPGPAFDWAHYRSLLQGVEPTP